MTQTVEIRGRGKVWRVFYPNEDSLATDVPVFDREGIQTETLRVAGPSTGLTEAHFIGTREEAVEFAQWLVPNCNVTLAPTATDALAKAREAKRLKREAEG